MKILAVATVVAALSVSAAMSQSTSAITVTRPGSQPSTIGPAENFTG